jgi:hypothetical protein
MDCPTWRVVLTRRLSGDRGTMIPMIMLCFLLAATFGCASIAASAAFLAQRDLAGACDGAAIAAANAISRAAVGTTPASNPAPGFGPAPASNPAPAFGPARGFDPAQGFDPAPASGPAPASDPAAASDPSPASGPPPALVRAGSWPPAGATSGGTAPADPRPPAGSAAAAAAGIAGGQGLRGVDRPLWTPATDHPSGARGGKAAGGRFDRADTAGGGSPYGGGSSGHQTAGAARVIHRRGAGMAYYADDPDASDGEVLPLDADAVSRAVADYEASAAVGGSPIRMSAVTDGQTVTVTCRRTVRVPFGRLLGYGDGLDRTAIAQARSPLD